MAASRFALELAASRVRVNKGMQPTPQPVIKFACANLPPVWRAAAARR